MILRNRKKSAARIKFFFTILVFLIAAGACAGETAPTKEELIEREEVAERVENALVSGYIGDWRGVERQHIFMKELDRKLDRRGEPPTGISDNIRDISYGRYTKRSRFLKAQKRAMKTDIDENLRAMSRYRLKTDEMIAGNELLADDTYNRTAFLLNNFIRSGSYVFLGYFPAVIDSGMNILLNFHRMTGLSIHEKKALILYQRYVDKYPDSREARRLKKKINMLKRKVDKQEYAEAIRDGREAYSDGKWEEARALFQYACGLKTDSAEALKWLKKTDEARGREREAIARSLEPAPGIEPLRREDEVRDMLISGLLDMPDVMIIKADALLEDGEADSIDDEARYLIAVAHDMSGAHEEAVSILKSVTRKHRKSNMARHARLALANPDYHRYSSLQEAQADYWLDTLYYIISGRQVAKASAIAGPSRIISQGAGAVQTLGMFSALGIAVRSVAAGMKNPVSDQEIITQAEEYLLRYPESKRAGSVHGMLAKVYERRGEYRKSIDHYRASGVNCEKKIRKLEEKRAARCLAIADSADESKETFYRAIVTSYPETKSAPRALEKTRVAREKSKEVDDNQGDPRGEPRHTGGGHALPRGSPLRRGPFKRRARRNRCLFHARKDHRHADRDGDLPGQHIP